ncbi:MAG: hypothetical protein ACREMS_07800 [Gemmatimonadaceae bacterium]
MRYRLTHLGVHQTALIVAIIYFILALIFTPLVYLIARRAPTGGLPPVVMLLAPVFYAVFGYIVSAIGCALYNLVASWAGGIALTLETEEAVG